MVKEEQIQAAYIGAIPKLVSQIIIQDYDDAWPKLYKREARRLWSLLGDKILALEHVGSTAVPGLAAKPVIDIDLSVENSADESVYIPVLEDAGYKLVIREPEWYEHRLLKGPDTETNLHVWMLGSPEAQRHVLFRDYLRAHEEDRKRYSNLKKQLAQQDFTYMYEYSNAKAPFISKIYECIFTAKD